MGTDIRGMSAFPWLVVGGSRKNGEGVALAGFATEHGARDYARWRNEGRRTWRVERAADRAEGE